MPGRKPSEEDDAAHAKLVREFLDSGVGAPPPSRPIATRPTDTSAAPHAPRWEYHVTFAVPSDLDGRLRSLGGQGWEVISVVALNDAEFASRGGNQLLVVAKRVSR